PLAFGTGGFVARGWRAGKRGRGCRPCESSIPLPAPGEGGKGMTAVDFEAFVDRLATVSGETILPFFRTTLSAVDKSTGTRFDPVTEADRAAEAAMRALIAEHFPTHGVLGEELGN